MLILPFMRTPIFYIATHLLISTRAQPMKIENYMKFNKNETNWHRYWYHFYNCIPIFPYYHLFHKKIFFKLFFKVSSWLDTAILHLFAYIWNPHSSQVIHVFINPELSFKIIWLVTRRPRAPLIRLSVILAVSGVRRPDEQQKLSSDPRTLFLPLAL